MERLSFLLNRLTRALQGKVDAVNGNDDDDDEVLVIQLGNQLAGKKDKQRHISSFVSILVLQLTTLN